jgi:hypothetical protein
MKRLLCGLVAWGLLVGLTGLAKAQYTFTTVDVSGSVVIHALGINASGQIVGVKQRQSHPRLPRHATISIRPASSKSPGAWKRSRTTLRASGTVLDRL